MGDQRKKNSSEVSGNGVPPPSSRGPSTDRPVARQQLLTLLPHLPRSINHLPSFIPYFSVIFPALIHQSPAHNAFRGGNALLLLETRRFVDTQGPNCTSGNLARYNFSPGRKQKKVTRVLERSVTRRCCVFERQPSCLTKRSKNGDVLSPRRVSQNLILHAPSNLTIF